MINVGTSSKMLDVTHDYLFDNQDAIVPVNNY
jgi:hypothetical protein